MREIDHCTWHMSITKKHSIQCLAAISGKLTTRNVENEYLRVIKSIYGKSKSEVKLETDGPWVPIKKGVRQGAAFTYIHILF